jgi:hypothetical protein
MRPKRSPVFDRRATLLHPDGFQCCCILHQAADGRSAKKPVAVVDLEYNETGFEDDDMRDHRIVLGVGVLGNVEVLLNLASWIG